MRNKLLNLMENINHKINKTEIEEADGQGAEIMRLLSPDFPHELGRVFSTILEKPLSYKGNMMSYMDGAGMIIKLESPTLLTSLHIAITFEASSNLYNLKAILHCTEGNANVQYRLFAMTGINQESLMDIESHIMTQRNEIMSTYSSMVHGNRLDLKSSKDSFEIVNQTYEDKLRKIGKTHVNDWKL